LGKVLFEKKRITYSIKNFQLLSALKHQLQSSYRVTDFVGKKFRVEGIFIDFWTFTSKLARVLTKYLSAEQRAVNKYKIYSHIFNEDCYVQQPRQRGG